MSKFDALYESAIWSLKESVVKTDFSGKILRIIAALQGARYITKDETAETITNQILKSPDKNYIIGSDDKAFLPKIELKFSNLSDVDDKTIDSLEVKARVLVKNNAITQPEKSFGGLEAPEEIPEKLVDYIKQVQTELGTGSASVENAPQETTPGNQQPGAQGGTALPTNSTPPAPAPVPAPPQ